MNYENICIKIKKILSEEEDKQVLLIDSLSKENSDLKDALRYLFDNLIMMRDYHKERVELSNEENIKLSAVVSSAICSEIKELIENCKDYEYNSVLSNIIKEYEDDI